MRTLFLIMSRGGGVSAVKFNLNATPRASSDVWFQALLEKCGIAKTRLSKARSILQAGAAVAAQFKAPSVHCILVPPAGSRPGCLGQQLRGELNYYTLGASDLCVRADAQLSRRLRIPRGWIRFVG